MKKGTLFVWFILIIAVWVFSIFYTRNSTDEVRPYFILTTGLIILLYVIDILKGYKNK
jgi:cytochrome c biogenesis factor